MVWFKKSVSSHPQLWFAGLRLSSRARKMEAALIGIGDPNRDASIILQKCASFDLPSEIPSLYEEILEELSREGSNGASNVRVASLAKTLKLRALVSELEEEALNEILSDSSIAKNALALVSLSEPRLQTEFEDVDGRIASCRIGDSLALAGRTGLNILEAGASSDLADDQADLPWLAVRSVLLAENKRDKLVFDLGETARWKYLPCRLDDPNASPNAYSGEIGPCGALLNRLAEEIGKGAVKIDFGGKLAVQGRRNPDLVNFWTEKVHGAKKNHELPLCYRLSPSSSTPNELFFLNSLREFDRQTSSLDALCSATHWIADAVVSVIEENVDKFAQSYDVVISGGAKQNGLLYNKITNSLANMSTPQVLHSLSEYGFVDDSFDAVATAAYGALFTLGASISINSRQVSFLGRVAPGSIDAWNTFVRSSRFDR